MAQTALWPFVDAAAAAAWQAGFTPGGSDAWHLDAAETALRFAHDYLGYDEVDRVVTSSVGADQASVTVGSAEEGRSIPVGVVALMRSGTGADVPWQVVGTIDSDLTIGSPVAGAPTTSPLTVNGTITGVDESIRVQVRAVGGTFPLGEVKGIGAGGDHQPWTATVAYTTPSAGTVLTVAVSTGGHVQRVEKFAVRGVVQT